MFALFLAFGAAVCLADLNDRAYQRVHRSSYRRQFKLWHLLLPRRFPDVGTFEHKMRRFGVILGVGLLLGAVAAAVADLT